jgi:sugar phosphate isomerase/epimerase
MTAPIALQLYTVREALAHDFAATVRRVAALGYRGVETAGFPGTTPQVAGRLFRELGLEVCGAHSPLPLGERKQEVLETLAALGCRRMILPWQPPENFATADGIRRVCDLLNEANAVAQPLDLTVGHHNHWFEYQRVGGRLAADIMLDHLAPEVFLEVDTYWVKTAGADPVDVIRKLGRRAPLLHIKDGPAKRDVPMTALGEGVMDLPAVVAASQGQAEWLIVELDQCATDMLEAVQKSYAYLTRNGLGQGRV